MKPTEARLNQLNILHKGVINKNENDRVTK